MMLKDCITLSFLSFKINIHLGIVQIYLVLVKESSITVCSPFFASIALRWWRNHPNKFRLSHTANLLNCYYCKKCRKSHIGFIQQYDVIINVFYDLVRNGLSLVTVRQGPKAIGIYFYSLSHRHFVSVSLLD